MSVGDMIRARREKLGMTQDELAEKMGYKSRSTIAKIEKGVNDVTQTTLVNLAKALNTTPAYLMGWVDEDKTKKNNVMTDIVLLMEADNDFYAIVKAVYDMEPEKRSGLLAFLQ